MHQLPKPPAGCRIETEFEVYVGDECVAITSGPAEEAERDAWHYVNAYSDAPEVRIYKVTKYIEPIG